MKAGIHLMKTKKPTRNTIGSAKQSGFYWIAVAKNGRTIARSSETYKRKGGCINSIAVAGWIFGATLIGVPYYDHTTKSKKPVEKIAI